jgi:hypothetical protein
MNDETPDLKGSKAGWKTELAPDGSAISVSLKKRLARYEPALREMNDNHLTYFDVGTALDLTPFTVARYVKLLGIEWNNVSRKDYYGKPRDPGINFREIILKAAKAVPDEFLNVNFRRKEVEEDPISAGSSAHVRDALDRLEEALDYMNCSVSKLNAAANAADCAIVAGTTRKKSVSVAVRELRNLADLISEYRKTAAREKVRLYNAF